jgi:exodeoxyribonuclease VII large subunit
MAEKISLTELQLIIRDTLYLSLPQMFWITAEISEITTNSTGHCYMELIEKNPDGNNIRARVRGIILSGRFGFISSFFENITGETLKSGLRILVKAKVEYHEIYGLSLIINDIDPAFTLGEMAVKRQLIIKRLEAEGVFLMNREIGFPLLPQRIAVISSKGAAGYTDFINHLTGNNYGYVFYTALFETPMQGTETEDGVIGSLDKIADHTDLFDLVVIIRGGGSQTDLSWFDSYGIAYHITQFPLPVVTGIGHEKNMSVTDMVASMSLKTPTAVADFLIDGMASAENQLNGISTGIREAARVIIEENKNLIGTFGIKLFPMARIMISSLKEKLSSRVMDLVRTGHEYTLRSGVITANFSSRLLGSVRTFSSDKFKFIEQTRGNLALFSLNSLNRNINRVETLRNTLNILNPENVLKRGYTITSLNGRILKSKYQLNKNDIVNTQFSDGKVKSRVVGVD